ncbi:hypothetical protein [Pseudaquabacterium pictum]|uniref:Flagella basal body P-ring formation protein FlgA C-terminal domain-containing protein n=1 Tax=Pseudaquabacterium pictum TaxID=2315236 RepID=A0A480B025_9BURK|nr:hypothetical protein [Rubrivivax pictus]GCL65687.1 hypothetical protein AQPW35_47680 [Rubrivivax pictus]
MTPLHCAAWAAGALLAALAGTAQAVVVAGPGGTAEQGRRLVVAEPAPGAVAPTLDLVSARLDAVDLAAGSVTVRGQRVPLHAEQLRVLGSGGQNLGPRGLRAGQAVRLALEPAMPAAAASAGSPAPARRIVLIYIDG